MLRNATLVVELAGQRVLVDPMLSPARSWPPLSVLRFRPRWNPLVELPPQAANLLRNIDSCLVSHFRRGHVDHLDRAGLELLRDRQVPVYSQQRDARVLGKAGLDVRGVQAEPQAFLTGTIRSVTALHGRGLVGRLMGPGAGFVVEVPGEPELYLSGGDTVLTPEVIATLARLGRSSVAVVHAGGAQLDLGGPILMSLGEVRRFAELAPGAVVAVHLEALNHCPTTRAEVRALAGQADIGSRLHVPDDGETIEFGR